MQRHKKTRRAGPPDAASDSDIAALPIQRQEVINLTAGTAAGTATTCPSWVRIGGRLNISRGVKRMLIDQKLDRALIDSFAFKAKRPSMDNDEGLSTSRLLNASASSASAHHHHPPGQGTTSGGPSASEH